MSHFKKFTDFCAGLSFYVAFSYLFREFLSFSPKNDPTLREKLSLFFGSDALRDYKSHLIFASLLLLSLTVGRLAKRIPAIPFFVSLLPFLYALSMYRDALLYDRPMLHIVLGVLHITGNLADALFFDRTDGKQRAFWVSSVATLCPVLLCLLITWRAGRLSKAVPETLRPFDREILYHMEDADLTVFYVCIAVYLSLLLISFLLRGAYWLNFLISLFPLFYLVHHNGSEQILIHFEQIITLAVVATVTHLSLMLCAPPPDGMQQEKTRYRNGTYS